MKSREEILNIRWIKPFAHRLAHPALWHINRRSLSKALGLGLFAGFVVPLGQIPLAALLAIPARANVPAAIGATFVTNPFTFGPIVFAEYQIGHFLLALFGLGSGSKAETYTDAALGLAAPFLLGMVILAVSAGLAGFALSRAWLTARLAWHRRSRRSAQGAFGSTAAASNVAE